MKKLICLVLAILCVLPLAACGYVGDVPEQAPVALMSANDLQKLAANGKVFEGTTAEESKAIWEYTAKIVQEWYAEYLVMANENLDQYKTLYTKQDSKEYAKSYYSNTQLAQFGHTSANLRPTRTVETLTGWLTSSYYSKNYELDVYGGWINESLKQEATGNFYVKKLGNRWYYIDPLGYPCITVGVVGPMYSYADNETQRESAKAIYGSEEKWAIATVRTLKEEYGFNLMMPWSGSSDPILDVPEGAIYQKSTYPLRDYGASLGMVDTAGSTYFDGKAMPVFDEAFPEFVDTYMKETLTPLIGDERIVGFTTDNEIPIEQVMLDNYLTVNPDLKAWHRYSYAAAWTWLAFMTGKDNPSTSDITNELRELFRGFVYYRYFAVIAPAVRKYAPDHMYGGVRFYTPEKAASLFSAEWVVRFAGKYCDYICINWYRQYWTLTPELAKNLTQWSGDKPFVITEFYAKSDLYVDQNDPYTITSAGGGGGFHVDGYGVQNGKEFKVGVHQARADYYENSVLAFMEWGNMIGWHWYRYNHYWISGGLNRAGGIVSDSQKLYPEFAQAFENVNNHVYGLAEFFDARKTK